MAASLRTVRSAVANALPRTMRPVANASSPASMRVRACSVHWRALSSANFINKTATAAPPGAIEMIGQTAGDRFPQSFIVEPDGLGGALLDAGVRIAREVFAHRRELAAERAHQIDADAAAAGQRAGGTLKRQLETLVQLRERGLVHAHRMQLAHFLSDAQPVAHIVLAGGG